MKKVLLAALSLLSAFTFAVAQPQPARLILAQEAGRITFVVDDDIDPPASAGIGWGRNGEETARDLHRKPDGLIFTDWEPEIIANSFADELDIQDIGEDVVFRMLLKAWCTHRPVVLSPDAIWLVISQQVSHCINENPKKYRSLLVNHEGKKDLSVITDKEVLSEAADWAEIIAEFTSQIDKYTNNGIATTLVADFSTTGVDERIASEATLMDAVKPYFDYELIYLACGIPSITLTGTPDDWRKVLEKTRALKPLGFGWWVADLVPILKEFIKAAEGEPDYWFWKDIVMQSRPENIQGPSCGEDPDPETQFDGWFLKLFPFNNDGRTPETVTVSSSVLPETVAVPFKYKIVDGDKVLSETPMELVAGIVGVTEDPTDFTLTPKIGWFVRTVMSEEVIAAEKHRQDSVAFATQYNTNRVISGGLKMDSSVRYWDERPLTFSDLTQRTGEWPEISEFEYGYFYNEKSWKVGNTEFKAPSSRAFMNPYTSWVHPDYASEDMLLYFQTLFDYVEICRRRAETDFAGGSGFSRPEVMRFHLDVADSFFAKMKEETRSGLDSDAVHHYSRLVSNELAKTTEPQYTDLMLYPKGCSLGMHAGVGNESYTGALAGYFNPVTGLKFGFDFSIGRVLFVWDILLGTAGRLKQDFPRDGYEWKAGERISGGNMDLALGYTVYDSKRWKFSPYAGFGVGFRDYPTNPVDPSRNHDEVSGFRLMAGVSADFKLYRSISINSYMANQLNEVSLRTKLYVARTAFPTPGPSWSVNVSVGVNLLAWLLKK